MLKHFFEIKLQDWLSKFASAIIPPQTNLLEATRQSDHMIQELNDVFDEEDGIYIDRVIKGGSNATHTTIMNFESREFDVDVHFYLSGENVGEKQLRRFLKRKLIEIYPNKDEEDFKTTKSSVEVSFKSGIQLKIDVVPVVHETTRTGWWGYIPRPNGEKLWTNVPEHIRWVRDKTANSVSPVKFNRMVRLMKWWKREQKIAANSFSVMILTGYSFDSTTFSSQWRDALKQMFNYYHTTWTTASNLGSPVSIPDPINQNNNAANGWTKSTLDKLKAKAKDAEQYVENAYNEYHYGDKDEAIQYLYMIFGSKFLEVI